MALRLIRSGGQEVPRTGIPEKGETIGGTLGRNLSRLAARFGESAIGQIGEAFTPPEHRIQQAGNKIASVYKKEAIPEQIPEINPSTIKQKITEPLLGKEAAEPQGSLEEIADMVARSLPQTLALKGVSSFGKELLKDIGTSTAMKIGEKSGLSDPISQLALGYYSGRGFDRIAHYLKGGGTIQNLATRGKEAEQKYWNKSQGQGSNIHISAKKFENKINGIESELNKTSDVLFKEREKQDLINRIAKYKKDSESGMLNLGKVVDEIKDINELHSTRKSRKFDEYLKRLQSTFFDEIDSVKKSHPGFYKNYNTAKDLTKANNFHFNTEKFIEDNPESKKILTNPIAQAVLGFGVKGIPGALVAATAGAIGRPLYRRGKAQAEQIAGFLKYPGGQQILKETVEALGQESVPQILKSFTRLNKVADKYTEQEEKPNKKLKGFTLHRV